MPQTSAQHGRSLDENIDILFDEITLAAQWGRPSLLLAVHKSKFGQDKAERILETRLGKEGFQVERIVINDRQPDLAQLIREAPRHTRPVYFISNLDWGGGEDGRQAYRALNLHRELFVEEAIRAVFWLTVNEAANLPRFAPDFWAFRHRVVEFISQRALGKVQLPAGVLAWDIQRSPDPFEDVESGIRAREELLQRLPDSLEALSTRVELHGSLGYLHWTLGDLDGATQEFEKGWTLAKDFELPDSKASLLNGLGITAYDRGDPARALDYFNEGLSYRPASRALLVNMGATHCVLGRIQEGLAAARKAAQASPADAGTWSRLGYIQNAAGKPDEAIACLAKAAELAPRAPEHRVSLAVMYSLIDRTDDVRAQLRRAMELAGTEGPRYAEIVREALLGQTSRAQELLRAAVDEAAIPKQDVRRDPNLILLFDAAQLEQILA